MKEIKVTGKKRVGATKTADADTADRIMPMSFRMSRALHTEFVAWADRHGMGAGEAVTQAIRLYTRTIDSDQWPEVPAHLKVYVGRCEDVLAGGNEKAINALKVVAELASEVRRLNPPEPARES